MTDTPGIEAEIEPEAKPKLTQRKWVRRTVAVGGGFIVGAIIGSAIGAANLADEKSANVALAADLKAAQAKVDDRDAQTAADQAEADHAKADADKAAADQAAADKAAADKAARDAKRTQDSIDRANAKAAEDAAAAAAARTTIPGSGTFAIGSEKEPGTYKTAGPADGDSSCYYAVLTSPTGEGVDNIIDNNNISGQGLVSLKAGQFFQSNGCEDWTRT
jgi:hypothetical protein